ncbi:hypothetical protein RJ641_009553 [Dillenia turbinata]|uniref:Uncharacterized protein n=1 Tax=Dillenia turbinata TaxID=194707 RepID=A0AAN8VD48_9MAGN
MVLDSVKWGYIRIITGTIGGGILGFYVMHRVETNYRAKMQERLIQYQNEKFKLTPGKRLIDLSDPSVFETNHEVRLTHIGMDWDFIQGFTTHKLLLPLFVLYLKTQCWHSSMQHMWLVQSNIRIGAVLIPLLFSLLTWVGLSFF